MPIAALLTLLLAFAGCEESHHAEVINPEIKSVSTENTYIGDTVSFFGENFGTLSRDSKVEFPGEVYVNSFDCVKWTISEVSVEVPLGTTSGTVTIHVGEQKSAACYLEIDRIPPLETIEVPAGTFMMGSDKGLNDEQPVHEVEISKPFIMTKFEITKRFRKIVTDSVYAGNYDDYLPVEDFTWLEAVKFCNILSELKDYEQYYEIDSSGNVEIVENADGCRLPTEAEWEYACRAGTSGDYGGTGVLSEMGWYAGNSGFKPHPVGKKKANAFGLHDMHGNAREWCWDWYDPDYYAESPAVDPLGPDNGERRVQRGGAWFDGTAENRSANRKYFNNNSERCGLRVVRTITD